MRILIGTDTWRPQVNGVVRTLQALAGASASFDAELLFLTPEGLRSIALPTYPGLRLAIPRPRTIAEKIEAARPNAIHIASEGPIGHLVRRYCLRHGLNFTTSFHTRFPEYVAARLPIPQALVWTWLRRFHAASSGVMAATPALARELTSRGFRDLMLWPRGVDADLFRPRPGADLDLPRPVFLTVGRLAVEKNLPAFLSLDLPGTKVVVGEGPARDELVRQFPDAVFLGAKQGEALAEIYAAADVFVFPSLTDTYGLVLLEALASGVPVAGFPVSGPRDVIGDAPVGALHDDLRAASLRALTLSRQACRDFALAFTWTASARCFLDNVASAARARQSRPTDAVPIGSRGLA